MSHDIVKYTKKSGCLQILIKGSGSDGNCTIIKDLKTNQAIAIDAGVKPPKGKLLGVFITHCHSDHVSKIHSFDCTIYGPLKELNDGRVLKQYDMIHNSPRFIYIEDYDEWEVGPFTVYCIPSNHDTVHPVHYIIKCRDMTVFYGCDSVSYPDEYDEIFDQCDLIMVDSNYDNLMINESDYPDELKLRITKSGHASNQYIKKRFWKYRTKLVLYHISSNNNMTSVMDEMFTEAVAVVSKDRCPFIIKYVRRNSKPRETKRGMDISNARKKRVVPQRIRKENNYGNRKV